LRNNKREEGRILLRSPDFFLGWMCGNKLVQCAIQEKTDVPWKRVPLGSGCCFSQTWTSQDVLLWINFKVSSHIKTFCKKCTCMFSSGLPEGLGHGRITQNRPDKNESGGGKLTSLKVAISD
jgi:hypothetical protein